MKTKSTEQQTTFTNTIAEKDAEIAAWKDACRNTAQERQELYKTIAKLNEALDIAEHGLVVTSGLWATDLPNFQVTIGCDQFSRMIAYKDTYWRINNAADLAKIRELRG